MDLFLSIDLPKVEDIAHEVITDSLIGCCVPGIYANRRTKLGKIPKIKDPTYETAPLHGEPNIIHAMEILIEERISTL